jgi:high affinity sulfate transporter 1
LSLNGRTSGRPRIAFEWLASYRKEWLSLDVVAGLTAAAVVIPKALAYATIAGLPVEVGLYTAFVPLLVYAIFGTSRPLSVSTTTTIAILTGAQLSALSLTGDPASLLRAAATLTLLVGVVLVVASVLRMGFLANFISEPVLVGFKAGIGVVIVLDQLPKLLGIHIRKGGFFHNVLEVLKGIPETSIPTLVVGAVTIALLAGLEHFAPKLPAPLIAIAVAILGVSLLGLGGHGVGLVGHVPQGFPSPILPDVSLAEILWPGALGIALMSFTETMAAGRAFARGDEPIPRGNRELLATGLGNGCGALLGAMPSGGGTSQTAVNRLAGARTQLAQLVTAAATLLTMLFLAPLIGLMPHTTLAAVVIVYSVGLIKPAEFAAILRIRRLEFIWAVVAFAGVVLLGTLKGILVAIVVSVVGLAFQVADPPVHVLGRKKGTRVFRPLSKEHPDDETFSDVVFLRLEGRVFFLNAERVGQKIRDAIGDRTPPVVVLDLSGVFDFEYTALKMLTEGEKKLRDQGILLWLAGLTPNVLEMVQRSTLGETLGRERMHFDLEEAVRKLSLG